MTACFNSITEVPYLQRKIAILIRGTLVAEWLAVRRSHNAASWRQRRDFESIGTRVFFEPVDAVCQILSSSASPIRYP